MNKLLNNTKILKFIGVTIVTLATLFQFISIFNNSNNLSNIFTYISILVVFSLPSLISKVVFKDQFFGIKTVTLFLIYPFFYIVSLILKDLTIPTILLLTTWFSLLIYLIVTLKKHSLIKLYLSIVYILSTSLLIFFIYSILGRSLYSVVSNDYMVHQSAVQAMTDKFCLLPSQCSNLFLIDTYTSFYQTIIFTLTKGFGLDFIYFGYILDIVFGSLIAFLIYNIFRKYKLNHFYSVLGSVVAILIFEQGAYTYQLFIPQTFAFFLSLYLILEKKYSKLIILAFGVIFSIHFIMGIYALILFIIHYLFQKNFFWSKLKLVRNKEIVIYTLLVFLFVLLLSITGFSIEKTFQAEEIKNIGGASNYYYPENIKFLFEVFGLNSILFIVSVIYLSIKKLHTKWTYLAIANILAVLSVYFLAPIYANKFIIGIGISFTFLICTFLYELILDKRIKLGIIFAYLFFTLVSFTTNYQPFLNFYIQTDGNTSAINNNDINLIQFIENSKEKCIYISDPQTQLTISALTGKITDSGSYSSLESRRILNKIVSKPNSDNLSTVFDIKNTNGDNVCLIYSSRLRDLSIEQEKYWLNKIYYYKVNSGNPLVEDPFTIFMREIGITSIYTDSYFRVYKINNPI